MKPVGPTLPSSPDELIHTDLEARGDLARLRPTALGGRALERSDAKEPQQWHRSSHRLTAVMDWLPLLVPVIHSGFVFAFPVVVFGEKQYVDSLYNMYK